MPARFSAGLLPFRPGPEVFLVHMAGPYWAHKDDGAWSIAKGEYDPAGEDPREVAAREFAEEVGLPAPSGQWLDLGEVRMPSGKRVRTYAVATDVDLYFVSSNLFELEWPPRSGKIEQFPETDGAQWWDLEQARSKLVAGQLPILDLLEAALGKGPRPRYDNR
jgi:predicted NUDIX family NTP pyrophosphohydrolase